MENKVVKIEKFCPFCGYMNQEAIKCEEGAWGYCPCCENEFEVEPEYIISEID